MGVLMQAFYWDCPREEGQEKAWWPFVASKLPELAEAGVTALWLPPASKAANIGGMSMGYDVYDYWDLGDHDQKGSRKTWYGCEAELRELITNAHGHGMKVYADLVLNHCSGADERELNPMTGETQWTKFKPKSGRFTRDWRCFDPSPYSDGAQVRFGGLPDLCHINPRVSTNLLNYAKWLIQDVGYDGFRYDFVKGFASWIVRAIHERTYRRDGKKVPLFAVAEVWDGGHLITEWLDSVNRWATQHVSAFDFPLRYRLKDMCDTFGYSLRNLANGGVLAHDRPLNAVTFVDNHDFRGNCDGNEIENDKLLAYAYILTHEGYPCVYWKDYFRYCLGQPGQKTGIAALVRAHEAYAAGATANLWVDDVFYAMQRRGDDCHPGLVFGLNNSGETQTRPLTSGFAGKTLRPVAWGARSAGVVTPITPDADGAFSLTIAPRSYIVLGPES